MTFLAKYEIIFQKIITSQNELNIARPIRIQHKDVWYYVMNRGRREEAVFKTEEDYQLILKLLKESSEQWSVNVTAFCLMSNHYHFFSKKNLLYVLETTEFQDLVKNKFFSRMVHPEIPESKELFSDIDLIINEVAKCFNVKAEDLLKIHRRVENPSRDVAIYLSRQLTQNTLAEIGEKFNNLKYSSVISAIQRVIHQIEKDSKTRKMIHKLIVNIKKDQIKI